MFRGTGALLGAAACAACAPDAPDSADTAEAAPPIGSLVAVVRPGSIEAPDSAAAGWSRLRLVSPGGGHNLIVMRLDSTDPAAIGRLRAALDTARATPAGALALGGPESPTRAGDTSEVIVHLRPGRHALTCLMRNSAGHRHSGLGEWRELIVTGDSIPAGEPEATVTLTMLDFAFGGPAEWKAGEHLLRAVNDGAQDHLFILHRLNEGVTLRQWIDAEKPGKLSRRVGGPARTGPGQAAYFPATLTPGNYVLVCLIPDPASGRPAAELGMFREIRVRGRRSDLLPADVHVEEPGSRRPQGSSQRPSGIVELLHTFGPGPR